ncbi:MAG: hypothetical protein ACKOE2_09725 [Actinomycetales bacterium]
MAHLRDAKDFLDSAEDDFESLRFKPAASNACLSTIRSSDAVCVAELGQRWKGDHGGATILVAKTTVGQGGARLLGQAVAAKNDKQYRIVETTEEEALALLEAAREMYDLARAALGRAGFTAP